MRFLPQASSGGPGRPKVAGEEKGELLATCPNKDTTPELWADFLECVRSRKRETLCTPELGAAAFTTVTMGVQSYRKGRRSSGTRKSAERCRPTRVGRVAGKARSKKHGKPNQIIGWQGGDEGSSLTPEDYQKLAGPVDRRQRPGVKELVSSFRRDQGERVQKRSLRSRRHSLSHANSKARYLRSRT